MSGRAVKKKQAARETPSVTASAVANARNIARAAKVQVRKSKDLLKLARRKLKQAKVAARHARRLAADMQRSLKRQAKSAIAAVMPAASKKPKAKVKVRAKTHARPPVLANTKPKAKHKTAGKPAKQSKPAKPVGVPKKATARKTVAVPPAKKRARRAGARAQPPAATSSAQIDFPATETVDSGAHNEETPSGSSRS